MIFVRDSIIAMPVKTVCKFVGAILLDLSIRQTRFALIAAYKPPSLDNVPFSSEMYSLLVKAISQSDNIICLGDLNCDISSPLNNCNKGRCLLDICDIYGLDSLNNSPTRISSQRSSCLDVILTNVPGYFRESGTLEVGLSDHCLVYAVLNKKLPQPKAEIIRVRSFKNFDEGSFCSDLSLFPFTTAYVFDDPEDVYWAWEKMFAEVLDDHAPVKSFRRKHRDQFQSINPEFNTGSDERT